jgi:hypothetical protein
MLTLAEVKAQNKANGMHFFSRDTMRFWGAKIHGGIRKGKYFITSEYNFSGTRRLFSVRTFDHNGKVETAGGFQAYATLADAKEAIKAES